MPQIISKTLAEYASSSSTDRIPREVRERAKQVIFDEIACAHFGRRSIAGDLAGRYAAGFQSPAEALILGTPLRVPAPYAALANGTAGHGEEVDGAHVVGGHPGASIVHAAVATAERQRASGADLVNAVVVGYELGVRAMEACGGIFAVKNDHRMHADFLYALGATSAAARILGLGPAKCAHAWALVTFQANGLWALYAEKRHISKSFCNGQYAFAGVSAALMAAAGLEGHEDIFGAEYGLLDAWGVGNSREAALSGIGQRYRIMGANFKFLNAGYPIHAAVEAAMTLVARHAISVDAISAVTVGMPANALRVVDNREMHNICVQDMLTAALLRGGLRIDEAPFPVMLSHPAFVRTRQRVSLVVDEDLERDQPNGRGSKVTIVKMDGSSVSLRIDHPKGHSLRGGVTWADLGEKWRGHLPGCDVDTALALAAGLEDLDDVTELTRHFSGHRG